MRVFFKHMRVCALSLKVIKGIIRKKDDLYLFVLVMFQSTWRKEIAITSHPKATILLNVGNASG